MVDYEEDKWLDVKDIDVVDNTDNDCEAYGFTEEGWLEVARGNIVERQTSEDYKCMHDENDIDIIVERMAGSLSSEYVSFMDVKECLRHDIKYGILRL